MSTRKMHDDELDIDTFLVRRLLATQFPDWAHLPMEPVPSAGTDNALFRLGDEMAVRLPRIHWAVGQAEKEHHWLPKLAPFLPLAVPLPLALGLPGEGYPWHWSVCPWLAGENATHERIGDLRQASLDLARFIAALQRIDPTGGPTPGSHNSGRGAPLAERDAPVRAAIAALEGMYDLAELTAAWETDLYAPAWEGAPVWLHGDLMSGNLLVVDGRLSAVIDFGCLGVGDPACDLQPAWNFFWGEAREVFRAALQVDDATWRRGRGWALSWGLIALPYYKETNQTLAGIARYTIGQVLADFNRA